MSRNLKSWVVLPLTIMIPMVLALLVGIPKADAADWTPPPPQTMDRCGIRLDQYYLPEEDNLLYADETDTHYLPQGRWEPTEGAASITVIAHNLSGDPGVPFTMTFDNRPDSACVEAPDTVTARVVQCNPDTNGTLVEFTYTNTDDVSDWVHTHPRVEAERWDNGQFAWIDVTPTAVTDGQSASLIGGEVATSGSGPEAFFLAPGTYDMWLTTDEVGRHKLPNRFFVPACGDYVPPPGDPNGGPDPDPAPSAQPRGYLSQVNRHRMRVRAVNAHVTHATVFQVVIDPRKGRTKVRNFTVSDDRSVIRGYRAPIRTRFVLKARVQVTESDGRVIAQWKVLKRSRLRAH